MSEPRPAASGARPLLRLLLAILRVLLWLCLAAVVLVAAALVYGIVAVEGRSLASLDSIEAVALGLLALIAAACLLLARGLRLDA